MDSCPHFREDKFRRNKFKRKNYTTKARKKRRGGLRTAPTFMIKLFYTGFYRFLSQIELFVFYEPVSDTSPAGDCVVNEERHATVKGFNVFL